MKKGVEVNKGISNISDVLGDELNNGMGYESIENMLGKTVIIHGFTSHNGTFGEFVRMIVSDTPDDVRYTVATGGSVVMKKLKRIQELEKFPVSATITRVKNYYDLQ